MTSNLEGRATLTPSARIGYWNTYAQAAHEARLDEIYRKVSDLTLALVLLVAATVATAFVHWAPAVACAVLAIVTASALKAQIDDHRRLTRTADHQLT